MGTIIVVLNMKYHLKINKVCIILKNHVSSVWIGILAPAVFLLFMSYYNVLMVNSYNYTNFDLGVSYRLMYIFIFKHKIIFYPYNMLISPNSFSKIIFIPLSLTLYINNSIITLLIDQIVIISIGGYAVFRIAQIKTKNLFISVSIEIVYFLYPAAYGFMTHGGNYMVYFEGFILLGYLFYLKKWYIPSIIAFVLAAISNAFAPAIIIAFLVVDYVSKTHLRDYSLNKLKKFKQVIISNYSKMHRKQLYFFIFLFVFNIILFISTIIFSGGISGLLSDARLTGTSIQSTTNIHQTFLSTYLQGLGSEKLPFFYEIFSPVLFIPILTPYFLLLVPYFILIFTANPVSASSYFNILQQYPYLFAAFIFIGLIYFFDKERTFKIHSKFIKKLIIIIIISSIISFAIYSPFSISDFQNGNVNQNIHVTEFDKELTHGLGLIPLNSSVFIQNDLPQLMNRENVYMPGYYNNQTVNYAVIIPFGFSPTSDAYGGYSAYWAHSFQNNLSYGVYEDIAGAIIYKWHYKGSPVYYIPSYKNITPGNDGINGYGKITDNNLILTNITNFYHKTLWGGGCISLSPGTYNFTFEVETSNTSFDNVFNQYIWGSSGLQNLAELKISGENFILPYVWTNFTITLKLSNYYPTIQFPAFYDNWNGTLIFHEANVRQISPA